MTIDSTVLEFVRHERLAWDAHPNGVHGHAWAFEKSDVGEDGIALANQIYEKALLRYGQGNVEFKLVRECRRDGWDNPAFHGSSRK